MVPSVVSKLFKSLTFIWDSFVVSYWPFIFLFLGFRSLEPNGLPRLKHALDSLDITLVDGPLGTSIQIGTFFTGICDLVFLFKTINTSGSWFVIFYRWIIFCTSCSQIEAHGSRWDSDEFFYKISLLMSLSSPPNFGKTISSNRQFANRAVNISPVNGSR